MKSLALCSKSFIAILYNLKGKYLSRFQAKYGSIFSTIRNIVIEIKTVNLWNFDFLDRKTFGRQDSSLFLVGAS